MSEFDYIKAAEEILECYSQGDEPQLQKLLNDFSEDHGCCLYALNHCCKEVSASVGLLLRHRQLWCANVLLRTVINATAKYCYLMVADVELRNRRLRQYIELATKADFGSMESPLRNLFKDGVYGSGEKYEFATREFFNPTMERKTQPGEGEEVRRATRDLDYWELSKTLSHEFWYWKKIGHSVDFAYAAANKFVHINYTSCEEIMRRYAKMAVGAYGELEDTASASNMLFSVCALARARSERLFEALGSDPTEMRKILREDNSFVAFTNRINQDAAGKIVRERNVETQESRKGT